MAVFWWPFWIQNGHHNKPTMDINSQHHNLLGNQISPKSEDFCILVAIIILRLRNFRMAAVATENVKNLNCSKLDET
jgi:hypothetical protein